MDCFNQNDCNFNNFKIISACIITKWGKGYYNAGQVIHYKVGQLSQSGVVIVSMRYINYLNGSKILNILTSLPQFLCQVTAQKMKFSIKNPQFPADLVTFTEEILNGKLHFLRSESSLIFGTVRLGFSLPFYLTVLYFNLISFLQL